jgi:WD40 repeat protein
VGGDNAHLLKWPDLTSKRVLSSGEVPLGGLQFSPDGQALYRFGREFFINFLQAWNLKTKQNASRVLTGKEEPVQCAAISFRRSLLAVAIGEGVQVRDLKNGKVLKQLKGFDAEVPSLSFSPDGNLLAAPEGRAVRVWNVQTGKPVKILTGCSGGVVHVAFSPDGKFLAARAHDSGVVHLWSTQTWKLHHSLPSHGGGHEGFVFSPDSRRLALNGKRGVFVHETQSGKQIAALKSITEGGMVQFSSDGRFLASTSSSDGALKLWRTGDWSPAATIVQWPVKKNTLPDWVAYTPEGYYTGSKDCEKYIRWRVDDELFPAKKYSKEFWRPDLVAEASKENT